MRIKCATAFQIKITYVLRDVFISPILLIALKNFKKKQDIFKDLFGEKYMYYHAEYMKNNAGKIIETKIVRNEKSVIYDKMLKKNIDIIGKVIEYKK